MTNAIQHTLTNLPRPLRVDEKYDNTQLHRAAHKMHASGGHFASSIAQAYFYADLHNRRKLLDAFGDLFERFIEP